MKVLITGGFGYIGGRLANFLNAKQVDVFICSRNKNPSPPWSHNFKKVKINWRSETSILEVCQGMDIIIHLASLNAYNSKKNPSEAYEVNCLNSDKLLSSAISNKVKKIIYLSTIHVYGSPLKSKLLESSVLNPTHPYAKSHFDAEQLFVKAHKQKLIESNIIRLSNSYGAPQNFEVDCWSLVINNFCLQAAQTNKIKINSEINTLRDFVTMTDTCEAIFLLMKYKISHDEDCIFNVGGNWQKSILQIANLIKERYYETQKKNIEVFYKQNFIEQSDTFHFNLDKIIDKGFKISDKKKILEEIDSLISFCIKHSASL